jgi:hypothetical protein
MTRHTSDRVVSTAGLRMPEGSQPWDVPLQPIAVPGTRIVETQPLYPAYVLPLAVATLAFLMTATAFAARLLDAIGHPASVEQLEAIAGWGWSLVGLVLTLLVWGSIILPRASRERHPIRRVAPALLVSMIICCESVYLLGPSLIGRMESRATARERQCAVHLRVLAAAQAEGALKSPLNGIRSALLRAPVAGLSCDNIPGASRGGVTTAVRGMAVLRLGTAAQVYDNVFIPSVRSLRDAYNEYVGVQFRLVTDIHAIPAQQLQDWERYLEGLARTGLSPDRIARRDWPRVADDVRATGIPVPAGWKPTDKATFMTAAATALRHNADHTYNDFVIQHFQAVLPPGLSWESFYREPTVQTRWRTMIDAPSTATLSTNMGIETFGKAVYEPQLDRLVSPYLSDLLSPAEAFALTGRLGPSGSAAVAWAFIPTVLLYLVVLSIVWHSGRLLQLSGEMLFGRAGSSMRWALAFSPAFAIVVAVLWQPPVGVGSLSAEPSTYGRDDVLPLEIFWSLGSGLRQTVFMGFRFGYDANLAEGWKGEPLTSILHPERPAP